MTTRKILLVGIDGLRITDALTGGAAPHLKAFVDGGRLHAVTMEVPTISGPGWSSILTGSAHAVHGVFDNSFHGNRLDLTTDFLTRAVHADPLRGTFAASSWPPLLDPQGPGPVIATRPDDQRRGHHRLVIRDGETYGYRWADGDVAAFARLAIRGAESGVRTRPEARSDPARSSNEPSAGPDAAFVYLGEVDEAGHLYGGTSVEYTEAITRVDAHLGGILAEVEKRAQDHDEDWLVGITTDHGHLDEGGHGGADEVLTRSFLALGRYGAELDAGAAGAVLPSEISGILVDHLS